MGIVACSTRHDLSVVVVVVVSGASRLAPHRLTTSPAPNRGLFTLVDDELTNSLPVQQKGVSAIRVPVSPGVAAGGVVVLRLGSSAVPLPSCFRKMP